jgi:TatD DNase family protein
LILVDSHCHIDFPELYENLGAVLERAKAAGVGYLLCVSVNLEDLKNIIEISHNYAHVFASAGVHPNYDPGIVDSPTYLSLREVAADPVVVAVGETGLDYYRSEGDLEWQLDRFRKHIAVSREVGKPLIVHTRQANDDTISIMREEGASDAGGVMHCFSEDWPTAKAALDMGFYVSISGIVTFKNADTVREVARNVPSDRLLVETDAPYLAPVPERGHKNEPAFVAHTARYLAELRGVNFDTLAQQTTDNFFRLFPLAIRNS